MVSHWVESVLISYVRQYDWSVLAGILELALDLNGVDVADFLQLSLLFCVDSVAGFEGVLVGAVPVVLAVLSQDGDGLGGLLGLRRREHGGGTQAEQDLEAIF